VPPLDPAEHCHGITLWLQPADRAALEELAAHQEVTPEALASLAVRYMLAHARTGILPMLKPPEEAPPSEMSWEEIHLRKNLWDAKALDDPEDIPEEALLRPARANLSKALYTVERLLRLADEGLDPANPQGAMNDIARLATVRPPS
jgi:hypothetical protein